METDIERFSWTESKEKLCCNIMHLYVNEMLVDVSLCCQGNLVKAHKVILSCGSGYFRRKFSEENQIYTMDIDKEIGNTGSVLYEDLKCVVDFMYGGEIDICKSRRNVIYELSQLLEIEGLLLLLVKPEQHNILSLDGVDISIFSVNVDCVSGEERFNELETALTHQSIDEEAFRECNEDAEIVAQSQSLPKLNSIVDDTSSISIQTDINMGDMENYSRADEMDPVGSDEDAESGLAVDYAVPDSEDHSESVTPALDTKSSNILSRTSRRIAKTKQNTDYCSICGKRDFSNSREFKKHFRTCKEAKKKVCHVCEKSFDTKSSLNDHFRLSHKFDSKKTCSKCGDVLASKTSYRVHLWKVHKQGYAYNCDKCSYTTPVKSYYQRHLNCHEGNKTFSCKTCNKTFKSRNGLKGHAIQHNDVSCKIKCLYCDYVAFQKSTYTNHLATKHGLDKSGTKLLKNKYKCSQCNFCCVLNWQLRRHIQRKHSEKQFKCEQCDYCTVEKAALSKHRLIRHTKEKPYSCTLCDFTTNTRSTFCRHKRSHSGVKPYRCDKCGKMYADKKKLDEHLKDHTDPNRKPYVCGICWYACKRKDNLQTHYKKKHKHVSSEETTVITQRVTENSEQIVNGKPLLCTYISVETEEEQQIPDNEERVFISGNQELNTEELTKAIMGIIQTETKQSNKVVNAE